MARLFTYTMPIDDGAAPNPFFGMCTLAICKPGIRRAAQSGDWVAGLGGKRCPSGDLSGHLVYAMHVEQVLTMREYDKRASREWPDRIPNIDSANTWERLGSTIWAEMLSSFRSIFSLSATRDRGIAAILTPPILNDSFRGCALWASLQAKCRAGPTSQWTGETSPRVAAASIGRRRPSAIHLAC